MKSLVYQSESMKIGKTYWRLQINKDDDSIIPPSVSGLPEFSRGAEYSTTYQYHDGMMWKDCRNHPRYDSNNGATAGLPKGLSKLYKSNEKIVKFWTSQFEVKS